MGQFFSRERFGRPQIVAAAFLLVFLAQCAWLVQRSLHAIDAGESFRVTEGLKQWHGEKIAGTPFGNAPETEQPGAWFFTPDGFDPHHSPLWYLASSVGLAVYRAPLSLDTVGYWGWLARGPSLVFGVMLGASLWYVARRLYGNAGGYIALALYCFSPGVLRATSQWFVQAEMGAAWGAFGAIFTAIAVAHTLYAPREVVLWNWRRILLLGVSFALAVGSQFSLVVVAPLALAFMLYVAPTRRVAAITIWTVACVLAGLLLWASYFFHFGVFAESMGHARFFSFSWKALAMPGAWREILAQLGQSSPALLIIGPVALIAYFAWPRARYFGNTAPLLISALFLVLALGNPHYPGLGFQLAVVPFLFLFVTGVMADLLETRYRSLVLSCVLGLLLANGVWNLWELARAGAGNPTQATSALFR